MIKRMATNVSYIIRRHKSEMGYVGLSPDALMKMLSQSATLNAL
jgi:hypothetical protein